MTHVVFLDAGMQVTFAQPPGKARNDDELPLDALLRQSDAVSLHVPLTPATRGMIDARAPSQRADRGLG